MKHHDFDLKCLGILISVGVLAAVLAVPAVASQGSNTLELGNTAQIDVSAYYEVPTYSVGIEWGNMDFCYKFGSGWDYTNSTFNQITITNSSLAPVGVELEFDGQSGYRGTFNTEHSGKGEEYEALYLSARESLSSYNYPSGSVYLILKGNRPMTTDGRNVGQITISLVDVLDSNLDNFEYSHGSNKIGHVTRDYGLVTFNENDLER